MTSTLNLIEEYRSTALAWDEARDDAVRANRLFKRLHAIFKSLRKDLDGRQGISRLMQDPTVSVGVRLIAASDSLAWDPTTATKVLEAIERDGPGLYRTTARYTLKAFREGTLDWDW